MKYQQKQIKRRIALYIGLFSINLNRFILKIIFFISFIFGIQNERKIIGLYLSEINLIIQGNNQNCKILSDDFQTNPSEVKVNGISNSTCQKTCYLNNILNNVTIIFDEQITTCEKMFYGLNNIYEIDLSNFDISNVINMNSMFEECSNLEKINFGNINTSLVQTMSKLFYNCTKLSLIDVSNVFSL